MREAAEMEDEALVAQAAWETRSFEPLHPEYREVLAVLYRNILEDRGLTFHDVAMEMGLQSRKRVHQLLSPGRPGARGFTTVNVLKRFDRAVTSLTDKRGGLAALVEDRSDVVAAAREAQNRALMRHDGLPAQRQPLGGPRGFAPTAKELCRP